MGHKMLFHCFFIDEFSPLVRQFIEARDFENSGSGRKISVLSLQDGKFKGDVELNDFVFGSNPRFKNLIIANVNYKIIK